MERKKQKGRTVVSRRLNDAFLNYYIELDKVCCEKFGVSTGGVSEYISRLNNARFAPDRDEVLPKLVRYMNVHKRFAYEPGAIRKGNDIGKEDLKWVLKFKKSVIKKKDPISKYLKKARRYAFKKKLSRVLWGVLAMLAVVAVIALVVVLV